MSTAHTALADLKPTALWSNFADICQIPHPSHHEKAIIAHLAARAQAKSLETSIDEAGNLIVRKPAHPDHQDRPGVILQAHVDMVPQANADTPFDFTKDPILPRQEGQWVKATGTTLGADNGIAVATMLTIFEDETLRHGPLEFLFTVEEETGLTGAMAVKPGLLNGKILLNLDNEEIGDIAIGCAGGRDVSVTSKLVNEDTEADATSLKVTVSGLKGGHSGCDIHLGRGNAIGILAHVLRAALLEVPRGQISHINGGNVSNAIPREASAIITLPTPACDAALQALNAAADTIKSELNIADPDLSISTTETDVPTSALNANASLRLVKVLNAVHNGVSRMSDSVEGIPETSANLGVIKTEGATVTCIHKIRSSINSARDALCHRIADSYATLNSDIELGAAYPGWAPNPKANILNTLDTVYREQNGTSVTRTVMHAGLECGLLGAIYPHWEMAAIGPTIRNPHSPDECVDIASVETFWNWLIGTLKAI